MLDKPAIPPHPQWEQVMRAVAGDTPNVLDFLERCENCGLPVGDKIIDTKADHEFAERFLENFFPGT